MKIAVAKGDGIGPEIMDAVLMIFKANKVELDYEFVDMGKWVFDKGFSNGMTPEAQQTIENLGLLFKGPHAWYICDGKPGYPAIIRSKHSRF